MSRMTLTMSGPDRLQEQLKRDSGFLHQFNVEAQKQLNLQLQRHGVAMVTDPQSLKLEFQFRFYNKL